MFSAHARWLLLAGLSSVALIACGGDDPAPGGTAGTSNGGTSAGSQVGGSGTGGSSSGSASGGTSGSGTSGSSSSGGGGASSGGGGSGGGDAGGGGSGGASGGSGGGGGSGGDAGPTAVANIMGVTGMTVTGTATFTQGATTTKLVLKLTACPDGAKSSHLHQINDCGDNGDAAMGHWPKGEMLGDYSCANGMATLEKEKPITDWTVGGSEDTDVTRHAFMVHAMSDQEGSGQRIGCGTFPQ